MPGSDGRNEAPFWTVKRLDEMTPTEWESLCDRCGRCCLEKLEADDTHQVYPTDLGCKLLDSATGHCQDYENRQALVSHCVKITPENVTQLYWLPQTCGYRRVAEGRPLAWWHPLRSGTQATVQEAGVSVVGRFVPFARAVRPEYHTVRWPFRNVGDSDNPRLRWNKAMFGGVHACVPACFGTDGRVCIDAMADHCFWLLSNGCHGLILPEMTSETASLKLEERARILHRLAEIGVPVSKMLVAIMPESPHIQQETVRLATEIGARGVLIRVSTLGKSLPPDIISRRLKSWIQTIDPAMHVYLSLAVSNVHAALTALDALMAEMPGRLRGIRDEIRGGPLAFSALRQFGHDMLEVYASDPTILSALLSVGGCGVMDGRVNLLSRPLRRITEIGAADQVAPDTSTVTAICNLISAQPLVPALKAAIAGMTGLIDWRRLRPPYRPLKADEVAHLMQALHGAGLKLHPPARHKA